MSEHIKTAVKAVYRFFTHRILWLFVLTAVLFALLFIRLFSLQIVEADRWLYTPPENIFIEMPLQSLRGTIYDRHGRPLAINNLTFAVMMDPSVSITNEALLELTRLFEENGERFADNFPIALPDTPHSGFEFIFSGSEESRRRQEYRWKHDMAIPNHEFATAEESFLHLRRHFRIDPELDDEDVRRILNFRCQIFMLRLIDFRHYNPMPILFAADVSPATMAVISERKDFFTGVFIDIQTQREYPGGKYMSHIIGYVGLISAGQYEANRHLGYTQQDLFGRAGLENALEIEHLRGTPGIQRIEVNRAGRRVGAPQVLEEPIPGDKVFLSIDLELQRAAYYTLKEYLTEALVRRLRNQPLSGERIAQHLSVEDALIAFVRNGNVNLARILEAEPGSLAYPMLLYILERDRTPGIRGDGAANIRRIIIEGLETKRITPAKMLLTLIGTGQINDPEGEMEARLTARPQNARDVLIDCLLAWELTPQQFDIDPSTGSIVIVDVHTGGILAAVSYPTFDNNKMVNVVDIDYFNHINNDPTRPLWFRALMEGRAPGSTIKMIPAAAALEMGTIGANTTINSTGRFAINNTHVLSCWHTGGHGRLNVCQALAVSCNVFFAEAVFRLGNAHGHATRGTVEGIGILNDYMAFFGLHEHSGVELWEHYDAIRARGYEGLLMASPEYYRYLNTPDTQWLDAYTAQVAIGQHISNFTPAQMARVMMGFANRNAPYPLHFVRLVEGSEGHTPVDRRGTPQSPARDISLDDSTWDTIVEGMRLVTEGNAGGTAVGAFNRFPVQVAGKTGTAQDVRNRFDHTAFGGFAPLHNPQIAIYVNVPFSNANRVERQMATLIARDMIGIALGIDHTPEPPQPINTVRP